jgi:hypothetical protein
MEAKIAERDVRPVSSHSRAPEKSGSTMDDNDPVMKVKVGCHDSWRDWTLLLSTYGFKL